MRILILLFLTMVVLGCSDSKKSNEETVQQETVFRVERKYTEKEVSYMDSAELRIKRNEIFAQYGYKFQSEELRSYFEQQDWYKPKYSTVDSFLTDRDKENISLILTQENKLNKIRNFNCSKVSNNLSSYTFNSSIQSVIDSLGAPHKTLVDEDEFCPVGQLHFWKIDQEEIELIVLGDSYRKEVDLKAKSRVYVIRTTNKFALYKSGFSAIYLGEEAKLVELKLNCLVDRNPKFSFSEVKASSAVERHFVDVYPKTYILTNGIVWIQFSINPFDRLDYILFSTLNIRQAC